MYTLDTITTAPSYDLLKRNNFTNEEAVNYYTLEPKQRAPYFNTIKNGGATPTKTITVTTGTRMMCSNSLGTQKCTSFIQQVKEMAREYMSKDFEYRGVVYNMTRMNYRLAFNNNKSRWGYQTTRGRRIELSEWMMETHEENMNFWIDTVLHEIAHAIDCDIRGRSNHDWRWRNIALAIGCNGERTGTLKVTNTKASKYTIKCTNCGHERQGHKHSRAIAQGRKSCGKCGNGYFDINKLLVQIQNY